MTEALAITVNAINNGDLEESGNIRWQQFIWPFAIAALAGNIIGGIFIFDLISHAQSRCIST